MHGGSSVGRAPAAPQGSDDPLAPRTGRGFEPLSPKASGLLGGSGGRLPSAASPWWRLRYELARYGGERLAAMRVDFPAVPAAEYFAAVVAYAWWGIETSSEAL